MTSRLEPEARWIGFSNRRGAQVAKLVEDERSGVGLWASPLLTPTWLCRRRSMSRSQLRRSVRTFTIVARSQGSGATLSDGLKVAISLPRNALDLLVSDTLDHG